MATGIQVKVWGDYALFSRPEFSTERASYEVMTPSAARGIVESLHWKPAIRWVIDRIRVLRPIRFDTIRRNEVASKASYGNARQAARGERPPPYIIADDDRQQRAALVLRDVAYVIDAHFEMTARAGRDDNPGKHADMARRRIEKGQCAWQPSLGTREFTCFFGPPEADDLCRVEPTLAGSRPLGWMLHDIDFSDSMAPRFFNAALTDGVLTVPYFRPARAS
ncbi:MAG: type I-C CRISPR-associated protein Cas5 [Magnetospirillum sp.]|nr:type I-C CRISPR-associated protein Cas5 [Magnetospirillum sp.]